VDTQHIHLVLEAALLSAPEPLSTHTLRVLFDGELSYAELESHLYTIQAQWQEKSIELRCVATGWRFQTQSSYQLYLDKLTPEKTPKYSRAVLETLAIIAYKQPVTRGDIEAIRGVTVASDIIKKLEERGWVEVIGHRDTVGRPALLATTQYFLNDLNLKHLSDLPLLTLPDNTSDLFTPLLSQTLRQCL
jgi:segregation and condensation protein B